MSAVVGAYAYGGSATDRRLLERMLDRLVHRGPDACGAWKEGPVALGSQQFWTTPESVGEEQPVVTNRLVLTASVRLDNREALIRSLGLDNDVSDARILVAAYLRWGDACPEQLLGAFAFAIWDRDRRRLFCARDHFGVMPFYYSDVSRRGMLLFATEIKALFEYPELERRINEVRLFEYLTGKTKKDREITIYDGVLRLPPGHFLTADSSGVQIKKYWSLEPQEIIRYDSEDEYAEHFLEVFRESVRCRMRSVHPTGSELSGGLDSSFVACVGREMAKGGEWHGISNVFDHFPECDEREYMDHVLAGGGIESHRAVSDEIGPLALLPDIYRVLDDPYTGGNHHMVWQCYQTARDNGVRVLLDGFDGDTVVGHGAEIFRRMADAGEWKQYWEEAQAAAKNLENTPHRQTLQVELSDPRKMLQHHADSVLEAHLDRLRYRDFFRTVASLQRDLSLDGRRLYRRYLRRLVTAPFQRDRGSRNGSGSDGDYSFINPDFLRRPDIQERIRMHEQESDFGDYERRHQLAVLQTDIFPRSLEIMDHYAAAWGIEVRHPYMDKRLVEYCLSLPLSMSFRHGWSRWVMRLAMKGVVPEEVRWRSGKANLAPAFDHGLFNLDRTLLEESVEHPSGLSRYVDAGHLKKMYEERDELDGKGIWQLAFLASLTMWWKSAIEGS